MIGIGSMNDRVGGLGSTGRSASISRASTPPPPPPLPLLGPLPHAARLLRPALATRYPPLVMSPILIRSRRLNPALMISSRFRNAVSASLSSRYFRILMAHISSRRVSRQEQAARHRRSMIRVRFAAGGRTPCANAQGARSTWRAPPSSNTDRGLSLFLLLQSRSEFTALAASRAVRMPSHATLLSSRAKRRSPRRAAHASRGKPLLGLGFEIIDDRLSRFGTARARRLRVGDLTRVGFCPAHVVYVVTMISVRISRPTVCCSCVATRAGPASNLETTRDASKPVV